MVTEVKHEEMDGTDLVEKKPKHSIGEKVRKYFEGSGWFSGRITSYSENLYNVVYDDGDSEEYDEVELEKILLTPELEQVQIGSRVAVYQPEEDQYYEATVTQERIDEKPLYLEYDNGASEWVDLGQRNFLLLEERTRRRSRLRKTDGAISGTRNRSSKGAAGKQNTDRSADAKASMGGALALSEITVGSRVAVYRPTPERYYEATVTQERSGENPLYLEYTCGDREWTDLRHHDFLILEETKDIKDSKELEQETVKEIALESEKSPKGKSVSLKQEVATKASVKGGTKVVKGQPSKVVPTEIKSVTPQTDADKPTVNRGLSRAQALSPVPPSEINPKDIDANPDLAKVDVGSRIAVYMPEQDQYCEAVVTRKRYIKKPYFLEYTNGSRDWIDLRHCDFVLLEDSTGRRGRRSRGEGQEKSKPQPNVNNEGASKKSPSRESKTRENKSSQKKRKEHRNDTKPSGVLDGSGGVSSSKKSTKVSPSKQASVAEVAADNKAGKKRMVSSIPQVVEGKKSRSAPSKRQSPADEIPCAGKRGKKRTSGTNSHASNGKDDVPSKKNRKGSPKQAGLDKMGKKRSSNKSSHSSKGNGDKQRGKNHSVTKQGLSKQFDMRFDVGTKVKKFFQGHGWFHGEVTSFNGWHYLVTYNDGDTEEYNEKELSAIVARSDLDQVGVGSRVAVHWPDDDKFYEATVVLEDRSRRKPYYVEYDTGHFEWLDLRKIKFCLLGGGTRRRASTLVEDDFDSDISVEACALSDRMETLDESSSESEFWKS